jgi:hypothetical protein
MSSHDDHFDPEIGAFRPPPGAVCPGHTEDGDLKQWIAEHATETECDYCARTGNEPFAAALGEFAEHVFRSLFTEYGGADDEGIPYETAEGGYQARVLDTYDVLVDEGVAFDADLIADLANAWSGQPWVKHGTWWLTEDEALAYGWAHFRHVVLTERRYWFHLAPAYIYEPSAVPPNAMLPGVGRAIEHTGLTREIRPGERLYRAQTHRPGERLEGAQRLGSPPSEKASSNRMSPAGISIFYGAEDPATAVVEVKNAETNTERSATTVGVFEPLRPLRVVDLARIPEVPGLFGPDGPLRPAILFLRDFAEDMSKRVSRDGLEHVDYVPTQVVAEWLRYEFRPEGERVDGVAYRSAQSPGVCVAIFAGYESAAEPGATPADHQLLRLIETEP